MFPEPEWRKRLNQKVSSALTPYARNLGRNIGPAVRAVTRPPRPTWASRQVAETNRRVSAKLSPLARSAGSTIGRGIKPYADFLRFLKQGRVD